MITVVLCLYWLLLASSSGQALEHWEPTGIPAVDSAVRRWLPASMCPSHFKDKDGNVRVADLALACLVLYDLRVPPRPNLPQVFVVRGAVGFTGKLLSALAMREGWDLEEVGTANDGSATWRIRRMDNCLADACPHWKPPRTTTMEMARKAGWTKRKRDDLPSAYETMGERMLSWRSITWLIDHYAPGVRLGIESNLPEGAALDWADYDATGPELVGEVGEGPVASPGSVGSDEVKGAQVYGQTPGQPTGLAPAEAPPPPLASPTPVEVVVPDAVYDNLPEARGMGLGQRQPRYDPDDATTKEGIPNP